MDSSLLPLIVDLDGTLTRTDTTLELLLTAIKRRPLTVFRLPGWIGKGRAYLKARLAETATIDATLLPYNQPLLEYLCAEHARGRMLVLATATHESVAAAVCRHLLIFDSFLASNDTRNLAGSVKRGVLVEKFGEKGFVYAGNEWRDLKVWKSAASAIVVNPPRGLAKSVAAQLPVEREFDDRPSVASVFPRAIRVHQWAKNLLIFVPVVTANMLADAAVMQAAIIAFAAFSLTTSAVYLINDLLDLEADRAHPSKHNRPLASGSLPIVTALIAAPLFLLAGAALSLVLPPVFSGVLLFYIVCTFAYSLFVKQVAFLDVLCLGLLYTVRIIAGHAATGLMYSRWLLVFAMFVFFSLALLKRCSELYLLRSMHKEGVAGRGYRTSDADVLSVLGVVCGYLSVGVFALYLNSAAVRALYEHPVVLWLLCPLLLFWVSRMWLLAYRGKVSEDPILFTLKDPLSWVTGVLTAAVLFFAH